MKKAFSRFAIIFLFAFAVLYPAFTAEKKPPYILYDFYADWCGPCKEMEPHIKAFEEKNKENVHVVKVDTDKPENKKLTGKYNVHGIPRVILVNQKGKILADVEGYMEEKELNEMLSSAASVEKELEKMSTKDLLEKAHKLISDRKFEAAYPYLYSLLDREPKNKDAMFALAHACFEDDILYCTKQFYDKTFGMKEFQEDPQKIYEYAVSLSYTFSDKKELKKVEKLLKHAQELNPDMPGLHYAMGMIYSMNNDPKESEKYYLLELQRNPSHEKTFDALISLYEVLRRWDDAIALCKKKENHYPLNYQNKRALSRLYLIKGDVKEALKKARKAAQLDLSSNSYFDYGQMLELLREEDKAKEAYQKVVENSNSDVIKAAARRQLNKLKRWGGKRKEVVFSGTQMEALTLENAKVLGFPEETKGLLVRRIFYGTQADLNDIQVGDVIEKINGEKMTTFEAYDKLFQEAKLGDTLTLEILRDGKAQTSSILFILPESPYLKLKPASSQKRAQKKMKWGTFLYVKSKEMEAKLPMMEKTFNEALAEVAEFFKITPRNDFQVQVFPSVSVLGKETGDYMEGHTQLGRDDMAIADNPFLKESLVRILTYNVSQTVGGRHPDMFLYGLGTYVAGTYHGGNIDALAREAFEKGKILSVQDILDDENFLYYEPATVFPMAGSFVKYLVENYEWDDFKSLWRNAKGSLTEEKFKEIIGEPLEDVEKKWLEKIGVKTTTASACGETGKCTEGF